MDKYKEIMNDWNYETNCELSLTSSMGLRKFQVLISVAQSIQWFSQQHICK
jgi:hypothetical protein